MPRLLKALPLMLAIAALSLVATSCGGNSSVRVVNAIPNNGGNGGTAMDVYFNGTKDITGLAFSDVYPAPTTPTSYISVPSGKDTIQAYNANTTTSPIFGEGVTATLSSSTHYTVLLGGEIGNGPTAYLITDDNTTPQTGNVEIRVINGSAYSATHGGGGIDAYIYQTSTTPPTYPNDLTITGLQLGESSGYLALTWESSYSIEVFLHGTGAPLFTDNISQSGSSTTAGQITTVVLVDYLNGNADAGISPYLLEYVDLN